MFLRKKAQSTAEYAITLGLVIAVAAGVLQVALKGGMRQKNKQAMNYMLDAGSNLLTTADQGEKIYSQEARSTTIKSGTDFVDTIVMNKGGAEKKYQQQKTKSESTSVELIDEVTQ
jgi:hypothetical protein